MDIRRQIAEERSRLGRRPYEVTQWSKIYLSNLFTKISGVLLYKLLELNSAKFAEFYLNHLLVPAVLFRVVF